MKPSYTLPKLIMSSQAGFTLVELIVVMAIFIVAIMLSSDAFNRIATMSTQQVKSSESNIQGIVGLEIMRSDIEQAGYGMPWIMPFVADFEESQVESGSTIAPKGINPKGFNDTSLDVNIDANKVPRAVQSATAQSATADPATDGRDYLVIKSAAIGMSAASKKWTYVEGTAAAYSLKTWGTDDFAAGERVIVLNSRTRLLAAVSGTTALAANAVDSSYTFSDQLAGTPVNLSKSDFAPQQDTDVHLVYGVSPGSNLRVPYNRADYYVRRPTTANSVPQRCAPGTGILYKALLNHTTSGGVEQYPLLECVADMQIVYGLDSDGNGAEDTVGNEDLLAGLSAKQIRDQLKRINVFILTHEGQKDSSYLYPNQQIVVGESATVGRLFDLATLQGIGSDWKNYRWKVYRFSVIPHNLNY